MATSHGCSTGSLTLASAVSLEKEYKAFKQLVIFGILKKKPGRGECY
jgi:hypothetical protein